VPNPTNNRRMECSFRAILAVKSHSEDERQQKATNAPRFSAGYSYGSEVLYRAPASGYNPALRAPLFFFAVSDAIGRFAIGQSYTTPRLATG